jgi:hypothetical protein
VQQQRPPQANIPQTLAERAHIKALAQAYVAEVRPVPPMPVDELRIHADALLERGGIDPVYREYTGVLINNEMWRDALAGIPYERRLLLMPKCLRVEDKCPAPFDEFGLLCKKCGLCSIQDLQEEAERLGYAVLVAEGSAIVMSIIETGKIEAIVGVSCISVLERAFPYRRRQRSPASPSAAAGRLHRHGGRSRLGVGRHSPDGDDRTLRMDLETIRRDVDSWFLPDALDAFPGPARSGDRGHRARLALARRQAVAPVPDRLRVEGADGGSRRCRAGRPAARRDRRRVLPQGVARPRRHRG